MAFDAIILAGARSKRLNGADKAAVVVGGRTLLERAVDAVKAAERTIVVGPRRGFSLDVEWVEDDGAGPVAAIAAGLRLIQSDVVVVLAVDYPLVMEDEVGHLIECMDGDGAIATDDHGRRQPLVAAYGRNALVDVMDRLSSVEGARVRDLASTLDLTEVALGESAKDCDTWDEIEGVTTRGGRR